MLQYVTHANKQIEKECNIWCSFYCQFIEDNPDIAIAALRGNFVCRKTTRNTRIYTRSKRKLDNGNS